MSDILGQLDAKGISYVHRGGDEYAVVCLNEAAHQDGQDSKPSLSINIEKMNAFCFACGFSMNEEKLTKWLLGDSLDDLSLEALAIKAKIRRASNQENLISASEPRQVFIPPGEPWSEDGFRGISLKTYQELGAIHCVRGHYADRIVFPVYMEGNLIGVDARALKEDMCPKYIRNKGSSCKTEWLYPYDKVKAMNPKYVIIAEGIYHALSGYNSGFPTLCFFGSNNFGTTKLRKLMALNVEEVIYFRDNDKAGMKAEQEICSMISEWLPVTSAYTGHMDGGKDLGDLTKEEIEEALEKRVKPILPMCLPYSKPEVNKKCFQKRCPFWKEWKCVNLMW